jgi:hypothetical protein
MTIDGSHPLEDTLPDFEAGLEYDTTPAVHMKKICGARTRVLLRINA